MTNTNTTSNERSASTDAKPDQGPTNGVTPHLTIAGKRATEAIEFYKKAFGAEEAMRRIWPMTASASCTRTSGSTAAR